MTEQSYFDKSQKIKVLIEANSQLVESLRNLNELEVLSNSGNTHRILKVGSVTDLEGHEYHIAVRAYKSLKFSVDYIEWGQGSLEYCAQEYAEIWDLGNKNVPSFAVGVTINQFGFIEHNMLLVEDLTYGGKRIIEGELQPSGVIIGGQTYNVDYDLIAIDLENVAKKYAREAVYFAKPNRLSLS